jgi:hypothetical protein
MPNQNSASQGPVVSAAIPWWRRRPSRGEVIAAIALFVILTAMLLVVLLIANTMKGDREDVKRPFGAPAKRASFNSDGEQITRP